jgi:hypothetical protein
MASSIRGANDGSAANMNAGNSAKSKTFSCIGSDRNR